MLEAGGNGIESPTSRLQEVARRHEVAVVDNLLEPGDTGTARCGQSHDLKPSLPCSRSGFGEAVGTCWPMPAQDMTIGLPIIARVTIVK